MQLWRSSLAIEWQDAESDFDLDLEFEFEKMINNLFTMSPAIWAAIIAGLIALPLLIHLINLVRHKTVEWAAMEFLLKSHKKNRNWVWLKQLILMLSRVAAFLLALFMLSQVGCEEDRIAALLGGRSTHHYVLLDDSFSMSDRDNEGSAFDRARSTLSMIVDRARSRQNQRFTLVRYSQPAQSVENASADHSVGDIDNELVDNLFQQRIEDAKAQLSVSNFAATLDESAQSVAHLVKQRVDQNAIVYLISDFRAKDWVASSPAQSALEEIREAGGAIELIHCAPAQHANLAITNLVPSGSVRVAESPLMMQVDVTNFSETVAEKIQIKIEALPYPDSTATSPADAVATPEDLPAVFVEEILPGETQTRYFPIYFRSVGKHAVKAELANDAIEADNVRHCVVEIASNVNVLIVDEADQIHGGYLALALSPNLMTGIRPEIRTKDFLRDNDETILRKFDAIIVCDIDQLDESAVRHLENYVQQGGGLAFFLGPRASIPFYNAALYKSGEGIFPVQLREKYDVPEQLENPVPDIAPREHPIFAPVIGLKNSLLDLVQVKSVITPTLEWLTEPPAQANVIATVRGDEKIPLAVAGRFGEGNTMAFLTTAGPVWNNWMRNATFPPILLLLEDFLASGHYRDATNMVGDSLTIEKDSRQVASDVTVLIPGVDGERQEFPIQLKPVADEPGILRGALGEIAGARFHDSTAHSGIYDVWFRQLDATRSVDRIAMNVDCSESEISLAKRARVLTLLEKANPVLVDWDQFNPEPKQKPASSLNRLFLLLLIGLLVGEQVLAYSASYHK
jgi:hypothetical protein